jgi:hypothetical protein
VSNFHPGSMFDSIVLLFKGASSRPAAGKYSQWSDSGVLAEITKVTIRIGHQRGKNRGTIGNGPIF